MSWYAAGNRPINSTAGIQTNASTATLLAEVDSTQLAIVTGASVAGTRSGHSAPCRVTWVIGASTSVTWLLEQATSTGLGSSAITASVALFTPTGQSGQYVLNYDLQPGDRLRARLNSSMSGIAAASIQVEPIL